MEEAKFIISKKKLLEQYKILKDLGLSVSYSYKSNREIGNLLQELTGCFFSIHSKDEIEMIKEKSRIWLFLQAESEEEIKKIIEDGINNFVVDNEADLETMLQIIDKLEIKINLSLRMKFQEHRIGSGKYFVYGMPSNKINEIVQRIKENKKIEKLGIHLHRKSQNTSEWEIQEEIEDSLSDDSLKRINFINLGGGLPSVYRSLNTNVFSYIFERITKTKDWLKEKNIETFIEPGRFLCAPAVKLITKIIQKYDNNLILNTTIYNCALDTVLTSTKLLVENEKEDWDAGENYLIKGNSPTRDDIFRYKVRLKDPKVGDKVVFLNAGAYNYTTDFFGYHKLKTWILEDFE
jgi:ornithine decarboxylase